MKHFLLSLSLGMAAMAGSAQFGTAPDFNVTDLDGNTHQLYADILDQGLIAVIDVSATWCGPCWNLHNSHALQELHEAYGPDGTNQLTIITREYTATSHWPGQRDQRNWCYPETTGYFKNFFSYWKKAQTEIKGLRKLHQPHPT